MKIAIVTGASSGLGGCFVKHISESENLDEIWVIARRRDRLEMLAAEVKVNLRLLSLDLCQRESIRELGALLEGENPDVRMLINCAGFGKIGSYADISLEDCERMIDLNCRAAVSITQVTLPYMREGARIMQICSTSAFQPFQFLNVYAASKAFLYRYSRALRVELFPRKISVTAVCPYWIKDTEFIAKAKNTSDSSYIKRFPLASREENVVKWALRDSRLGLPVSTPGPICFLHRIIAKFIPHELLLGGWGILRRI